MPVYRVKGPPGFAVHPGELMREILDEHVPMPIAEAARRMGVSRQTLYQVLQGKNALTAEMALRFSRLVGGTPDIYLQMQVAYDLFEARKRIKDKLEEIVPEKRRA